MGTSTQTDVRQPVDAQLQRTFWQRIVDKFFGYDFFISYAHADGKFYAEGLGLKLKDYGFECFLDTQEYAKGDDWKTIGAWALKRTSQLIVVGTQRALESAPVLREVEIFTRSGKRVIPVDFEGSLSPEKNPNNRVLELIKPSVLQIRERKETLQSGPSDQAVKDLVESFRKTRQAVKRRRWLQGFAFAVTTLLLVAISQYHKAEGQRKEAIRQLMTVTWMTATSARDFESDPIKATHHFLFAATLAQAIGDSAQLSDLSLAAQLSGAPIRRSFIHDKSIRGALLSPNEKSVLTWSDVSDARLWKESDASPIGKPMKQSGGISTAEFGADGLRFITFGTDGSVRLWDTANTSLVGEPINHLGSMGGAAFSPDGQFVLTWGQDNAARLWKANDGTLVGPPMDVGGQIWDATFDSTGKRFLTWSSTGKAQVWDLGCRPIGARIEREASFEAAFFADNGNEVITWDSEGFVRLWDVMAPSKTNVIWHGGPMIRAVSGLGRSWILRRAMDNTVRLWKVIDKNSDTAFRRNRISISQSFLFNPGPSPKADLGKLTETRLRIWDSSDGTELGEALGHDFETDFVAFSANGLRIATLNQTKKGNLWNAESGKRIGSSLEHASTVSGASFSRDSSRLLTCSDDGTIRIWDASKGSLLSTMKHLQSVGGAYFCHNGDQVVSWSADSVARIWAVDEPEVAGIKMNHQGAVKGAIFSKDGNYILTWSNDKTTRLWTSTTGTPIGEVMHHNAEVTGAMFDDSGKTIVSWSTDGAARLWRKDGTALCEPLMHDAPVTGLVINSNSHRMITWTSNRKGRLWNTDNGQLIGDIMYPVFEAAFNNDGKNFITHGQAQDNFQNQFAQIWSAEDGKEIGSHLLHDNTVVGATFTPDGMRAVTWGMDSAIRLWTTNGKAIGVPMTIKFTDYRSNWLSQIMGLSFSPNGKAVLAWNNLGAAKVWNLDTCSPITAPMVHRVVDKEGIVGGAFCCNASTVLTWGADGAAQLWNATSGSPIGQSMNHETKIKNAFFGDVQKCILTIGNNGIARLWSSVDGRAIGQALGHESSIEGARFASRQMRVLTWSADGTARLWSTINGACIGVFQHNGPLSSAVFSADGKRILTASDDGTARLWDIATDVSISAKERLLEFEVRSGTHLNADGQIRVMKVEEWNSKEDELARISHFKN